MWLKKQQEEPRQEGCKSASTCGSVGLCKMYVVFHRREDRGKDACGFGAEFDGEVASAYFY